MAARRLALLVVALDLAAAAVDGTVSCGGHFAHSCSECPGDFAEVWCHGDCVWVGLPELLSGSGGKCLPAPGFGFLTLPSLPGLSLPGSDNQSWLYYWAVLFVGYGFFLLVCAVIYYLRIIVGPPAMPKVPDLGARGARRGVFDCFKSPDTCMYVSFMAPIVQGKNTQATETCGFWPGCCSFYILAFSPLYLLAVLYRALLSIRIQNKLGFRTNPCETIVYSLFCMPCDLARESLEVDAEIGADITCCFDVKYVPRAINEFENLVDNTANKLSRSCQRTTCVGPGH